MTEKVSVAERLTPLQRAYRWCREAAWSLPRIRTRIPVIDSHTHGPRERCTTLLNSYFIHYDSKSKGGDEVDGLYFSLLSIQPRNKIFWRYHYEVKCPLCETWWVTKRFLNHCHAKHKGLYC